jgi:hypothetical protein
MLRSARVSLTRRSPGDDEGRFAVGKKGARRSRANVKGSERESSSIARPRFDPAEGVLVAGYRGANPTAVGRYLAGQQSSGERGELSRAAVRRQRMSEVGSSGEASSADGRGRSAAARVAPKVPTARCAGRDGPKLSR